MSDPAFRKTVLYETPAEDARNPLRLCICRFALIEGGGYRIIRHRHPEYEFMIPLDGPYESVLNGKRLLVHPGQQILFLSHSHGKIPRFLRSFPAYHSGNAAITQEKNEVFPSAKRNLPQELRYIVRNESILAKNVTKLEIISNEMIFLLQNAGELHIIAPLRENKEGIPCLS